MAHLSLSTQLKTVFSFLFFILVAGVVFGQNATLSVQGVLTKSDGTAVDDGAYPISFRLWTAESGGNMVHEETIQQVETTGGVYSVLLGANGFSSNATFSQVYYLGVSVNGGAELTPRPRLTHAPYTMAVIGTSNKFTSSGTVEADAVKVPGGGPATGSANKGYSFGTGGDPDGGLFSYADDHVGLFTNATERIKVTSGLTELKTINTNTYNIFAYGRACSNDGFGYHSNGNVVSTGLFFSNSASATIWANGLDRFSAWNDGNNYYKAPNGQHVFQTGNVQVDNNLNITGNISSNNDRVRFAKPLEVLSGNNIVYTLTDPVKSYNSSGQQNQYSNGNIAAAFQGDIVSNAFLAVSDKRIKKDFVRVSTSESLASLQKLQVTDYHYIDEVAKGNGLKKGFIAQEVEQIEPGAINISTGFIPSVYAAAEKVRLAGQQAVVKMSKPHGLQKGEKVRIYDGSQQQDMEVLAATETEFTVSKWSETPEKGAFVFGKEVTDFRAVDYDHIFTMNVAATQELARQVEELKNQNAALRSKLENQSATIGELARRMTALENAGSTTGTRK